MHPQGLVGRAELVAELVARLDEVPSGGGTVVLTGEPGVGKSALQAALVAEARERGHAVLAARGSESEAHLPFASLHQVLRPLLAHAADLPARQRDALLAGFGMAQDEVPDRFLTSLATLELLAESARLAPVVVSLDDLQWMDEPSREVLAFVARRIEAEPVLVLASVRAGWVPWPDDVPARWVDVAPLDEAASAQLVAELAPDLAPALRDRVLREAAGNPLALREFPVAMRSGRLGWTELSDELPMTGRLERAFVSRVAHLPEATRTLLDVAALDDGSDLAEMLAAVRLLTDEAAAGAEGPAVEAGLLVVDGGSAVLSHPLVGSALRLAMTPGRRQQVHDALAGVLAASSTDRVAWHRASATTTADEGVAAALEQAAGGAVRRGALGSAVTWLVRAAELSPDATAAGPRLLSAAEIAFELGRPGQVVELRRRIARETLDERDRARLMLLVGSFDDGATAEPGEVRRVVRLAEDALEHGDLDLAFQLLLGAGRRAWWGEPGADARHEVVLAARSAPVPADDPRVLAVLALAEPVAHAAEVLRGLAARGLDAEGRPDVAGVLGIAAFCVGDLGRARALLAEPVALVRAQGRIRLLAEALAISSWCGLYEGAPDLMGDAHEATRLADQTGRSLWGAGARVAEAFVAVMAGADADGVAHTAGRDTEALLAEAERVALSTPIPMSTLLAAIQLTRGLADLAAGRPEAAYRQLARVFDPQDPAHHEAQQLWTVGYLADAAVATDRRAEARDVLAEMAALAGEDPPPAAAVALEYARAVLADDEDAEDLFRAALAGACRPLPWHRARVELAYGSWLRRHRRVAESREALRSARGRFDAMGARDWAHRADQELRATGEQGWRPTVGPADLLSPQEAEIARLAAQGLSNREIAQRMYLSHRTVGSHLYRIFPKLGVTSRAQLGLVLGVGSVV